MHISLAFEPPYKNRQTGLLLELFRKPFYFSHCHRASDRQEPFQPTLPLPPGGAPWGHHTHKVHTVLSQPVEALEEEEESEEGHKTGAEVIPEDCEGKAGLGHCIP